MLNNEKIQNLNSTKEHGFTICGCCYKPFIKQCGSIYKLKYKGKIFSFCSYTCYRAAISFKENKIDENQKENK